MSTVTRTRTVTPPPPDNPFYYGWRDVGRELPDGTWHVDQVPLTLEDALHPQEGDHIVESDINFVVRMYLAAVFKARLADVPDALVLSDTGVYWDDPALRHHSPDLCVIFGVKQARPIWSSFQVADEGVRPQFILEIVSPNVRENDVETKLRHYHAAKVPTYLILDRVTETTDWTLLGYQRKPSRYQRMATDERGRIWVDFVQLWIGVDGERVVCWDGDTGEEIGDYQALTRQLAAEKRRAEAETRRAEAETQRAEAETRRAEAETRRAEAETRRAEAAEAKLREMEAELAKLREPKAP